MTPPASSSWPYTKLHIGAKKCIAISGVYVQTVDLETGNLLATTKCPTKVLCSAVDEAFENVVTVNDDKKMYVWKVEGLELLSTRELPKKSTAVLLTSPSSSEPNTIIVADKFGDVFRYPVTPPPTTSTTPSEPAQEKTGRESTAYHLNPHGTLVFGHTSIITCMLFTLDGKYVITTDRDEHIRVSRFPLGYVIERFCLGHRLYVSAISIPSFSASTLISGGGDPDLYIWEWMSGKLTHRIPILDAVLPLLKVRDSREKRRRKALKAGTLNQEKGKKGKKKKGKGRGKGKEGEEGAAEEETKVEGEAQAETEDKMETDEPAAEATEKPAEEAAGAEEPEEDEAPVLAVSKIEGIEINGSKLILFTVTGATALFYCAFPSNETDVHLIRHVEFSKPVLEFEKDATNAGKIVVSVDPSWVPESPESESKEVTPIYVVEWKDGEFNIVEDTVSPLVKTLNRTALQEASFADLTALDLYGDLLSLPKHAAEQEDSFGTSIEVNDSIPGSRPGTPDVGSSSTQALSKRQIAKIEGRKKLKEVLLKKQGGQNRPDSEAASVEEEREAKKVKVD
ncbi:hypothetical protein M422DRAFT_240230 [Sphaerobolus stellatus SS14]|nr:hypothetical protein M422DRAFT_240230 [Sphaerobolus stellatus SS14]